MKPKRLLLNLNPKFPNTRICQPGCKTSIKVYLQMLKHLFPAAKRRNPLHGSIRQMNLSLPLLFLRRIGKSQKLEACPAGYEAWISRNHKKPQHLHKMTFQTGCAM